MVIHILQMTTSAPDTNFTKAQSLMSKHSTVWAELCKCARKVPEEVFPNKPKLEELCFQPYAAKIES